MKLTILTTDMKAALKDLKKVFTRYENKHNKVTSNYIGVFNEGGSVYFTAFDESIIVKKEVPGDVMEGGAALIPFDKVYKVVNKLKTERVTLEAGKHDLALISEGFTFKYEVLEYTVFPLLPDVNKEFTRLYKKELMDLFQPALYATSKLQSRPILTAVHTVLTDKDITAVSCDAHRLVKRSLNIDSGSHGWKVNITGTGLEKALKMDLEGVIKLSNSNEYTVINSDTSVIYIKNLEGNYPETDRLIPDTFTYNVNVDKKEFITALELAKVSLADTKKYMVLLEKGLLKVTHTFTADLEGSQEGDGIPVHFNPDFMLETLKNITASRVSLKLAGSLTPFIVEGDDTDGVHLITPIRLFN